MTTISILGHFINTYALCGAVGVAAGFIYLAGASRLTGLRFDDLAYVYVWGLIFSMIGAKLVYILINIPFLIRYISAGGVTFSLVSAFFLGGFVFYGGLAGAIIGSLGACRYFHFSMRPLANVMTPVLPLVHGFGRIGCSLVGCCYGRETDGPVHIIYHHSDFAPENTPLIPVQAIESVFLFGLFACLVIALLRYKKNDILTTYLLAYPAFRFLIEFFRGDKERGMWIGLSTSQWISLLILAAVTIYIRQGKTAKAVNVR